MVVSNAEYLIYIYEYNLHYPLMPHTCHFWQLLQQLFVFLLSVNELSVIKIMMFIAI
jgi:hypothetical protein